MRKALTLGWAVAAMSMVAVALHAAVPEGAKYSGTRLCVACHRAKHKEIVTAYIKSPMANALIEVNDDNEEKVTEYLKGDFKTAPFKQDDVAFILASGVHQQAYLDKDMKVLPAKWLVAEKKWVETPAVDATKECLYCHSTGFVAADKKYKTAGVGCEMCHGPGSVHISSPADKKLDTVARPAEMDPKAAAAICGQCHSKGRSTDGATAFPQGFLPGGDFNKFFKHDEVKGPGLNQQYTDLINTKHYEKGVVCNTCHDPHGETGNVAQLRKPITELCLDCHKAKIVDIPTHTKAKEVTPPADATCASCHMPENRHLFDKTAVKK